MADVYSRRRDEAKSKVPGIQTFDDHRRLLDMKDVDAVIVASPLFIYLRHSDSLAAGKDLYSEQTMTGRFLRSTNVWQPRRIPTALSKSDCNIRVPAHKPTRSR